jgi:hypothetical protein
MHICTYIYIYIVYYIIFTLQSTHTLHGPRPAGPWARTRGQSLPTTPAAPVPGPGSGPRARAYVRYMCFVCILYECICIHMFECICCYLLQFAYFVAIWRQGFSYLLLIIYITLYTQFAARRAATVPAVHGYECVRFWSCVVATEQRTTGTSNPMKQLWHCRWMCLTLDICIKLLTTSNC